MNLNDYTVNTAYPEGNTIVFTFLVADNPELADTGQRDAVVAYCVARYPRCMSGTHTEAFGMVVFTFVRSLV